MSALRSMLVSLPGWERLRSGEGEKRRFRQGDRPLRGIFDEGAPLQSEKTLNLRHHSPPLILSPSPPLILSTSAG